MAILLSCNLERKTIIRTDNGLEKRYGSNRNEAVQNNKDFQVFRKQFKKLVTNKEVFLVKRYVKFPSVDYHFDIYNPELILGCKNVHSIYAFTIVKAITITEF